MAQETYTLMAWTMPFLQWSAWLQYTHFGFLSPTVRVKLVRDGLSGDVEGTNPEKKPPARG